MLRTCPLDADCCTQAGCTISQIRQCHKGNDACRLDVPYGLNGASHCIDCIHRIASGQESVTRSNERGQCVPPAIGSSGNDYYSEDVCHSNNIDGEKANDRGQRQRPTTATNSRFGMAAFWLGGIQWKGCAACQSPTQDRPDQRPDGGNGVSFVHPRHQLIHHPSSMLFSSSPRFSKPPCELQATAVMGQSSGCLLSFPPED